VNNLSLQDNLEEATKRIEKQFEASLQTVKTKKSSKKKKIIWITSVTAFLVCFTLIFCIGAIPRVTYRQYEEQYGATELREVAGIRGLFMPFHFPMKNVVIDEENMGESVIAIGKNAFKGENIESITIPDSVYIILEGAFEDCTSLKYVSYNEETKENSLHNIQTIEVNAFKNCTRLESLTISSQIEQISSIAFDGCSRDFKLIYSGSYLSWSRKHIYVPVSVEYRSYTITIDDEHYVEVEYGEIFSLGKMPYKRGYEPDGYYYDTMKIAGEDGEGLTPYIYKRDIRVTSVYTPKTYKISFIGVGASNISNMEVEYDSIFVCPVPSSDSIQGAFIGWYFGDEFYGDGIDVKITDEKGIALKPFDYAENIILFAKYRSSFTLTTSKVVRVNFETNGGSAVESQLISSATPLQYPEIPTKNGYLFVAWYKDAELTEQFRFDETLDESITLYARWVELKEYDELIEINQFGGKYYEAKTYITYYAFVPRVSQDLTMYSTGGGDTIGYLYDETKINQLAMNDDYGGGFDFRISYYVTANTLYYLAVKSWSTGFDGYINITGDYENIIETSVTANNFTQQVEYNKKFAVPVVEIEGYKLNGYYFTEYPTDFDVQIVSPKGISNDVYNHVGDKTLYPWYTLETYTISYFDENGLMIWTGNPESYTIESKFLLSPASKYLYTFVDWYDNPEFTGEPIRTISNQTGDLVLYAKMVPAVCSVRIDGYISPSASAIVTFNSNGGTSVNSQVLNVNSPNLVFPSVPQKSGYIFTGWYIDQECTKKFEFFEKITESMELYAGWDKIPYDMGESYTISPMNYVSKENPYTLYTTGTGTSAYGIHNHIYFTSQKGGYITIHYAVLNASLNHKVGLDIKNVTQNYQHLRDTSVNYEYSEITIWVNYG
ncbi:MAG: InlB B-repeat-containing protein, partial [Anaeroplasmataceae bacterium]|nr:InlB B-repeat-containing protein [Anaeroplasmataceae bacterium]